MGDLRRSDSDVALMRRVLMGIRDREDRREPSVAKGDEGTVARGDEGGDKALVYF